MGKGKVYRDLFADRKETNINITVVCRLRKKWLIFGAVTSSETRRRTGSICISRKKTNSKQLKISDIKGDFEVFLLKTFAQFLMLPFLFPTDINIRFYYFHQLFVTHGGCVQAEIIVSRIIPLFACIVFVILCTIFVGLFDFFDNLFFRFT